MIFVPAGRVSQAQQIPTYQGGLRGFVEGAVVSCSFKKFEFAMAKFVSDSFDNYVRDIF